MPSVSSRIAESDALPPSLPPSLPPYRGNAQRVKQNSGKRRLASVPEKGLVLGREGGREGGGKDEKAEEKMRKGGKEGGRGGGMCHTCSSVHRLILVVCVGRSKASSCCRWKVT